MLHRPLLGRGGGVRGGGGGLGVGDGQGRVVGEAGWWAGSGSKTTWHQASLHHFRCVSDRMLANTCCQSSDGKRKLNECNVFTSRVHISLKNPPDEKWLYSLVSTSSIPWFRQCRKRKKKGKKKRETVI